LPISAAVARRSAMVAMAVALCAAPSVVRGQAPAVEVLSVTFEGNEVFPRDSLARAIYTRPTRCGSLVMAPVCLLGWGKERQYLARREFPRDQLRLQVWYQRRGFREAVVDTATVVTGEGVRVHFTIREGEPVVVSSLSFEGTEELEIPGLLDDLPMEEGTPLDYLAMAGVTNILEARMRDEGYAQARVLRRSFIPSEEPHRAEVAFTLVPGVRARYGDIVIEGNQNLSTSTILRTVQFRTGDPYRQSEILEAQSRLYGLELLRRASVVPDLGAETDSIVPVTVSVDEGDLRRMRMGVGLTSSECFDAEWRWVSRNFLGGGRRMEVRGRVANILTPQFHDILCPDGGTDEFADLHWLASGDFTQPWIFSTRNTFNASLFAERQSIPDVFVRHARGLNLTITRSVGPRAVLTLGYRPELSRLEAADVLFCTSFLLCRPDDLDALRESKWLSPFLLSYVRTETNDLLNPTSGYTLAAGVEHAGGWTGSDFRYDRVTAEARRYDVVVPGKALAMRARVGWVGSGEFDQLIGGGGSSGFIHPQKRFFAGGASSVRGFGQNRLGPKVVTVSVQELLAGGGTAPGCTPESVVDLSCDAGFLGDTTLVTPHPTGGTRVLEANLELRLSLGERFQGVTFTDVGQVWGRGEDVSLGTLEATPGVGMRYLSPIGPVRVDLAYRFSGAREAPVVTTRIRPFAPGVDSEGARLVFDGRPVDFVATDTLTVLTDPILHGAPTTIWSRFRLHLSIGQAF
ncbi:MAG: BamA/TamA family outer membrane protein, partial [Gemmatimonadota bacterium]|nr:BamA/TamA family outer membrane protein [Gemmatimonadota bacterium]